MNIYEARWQNAVRIANKINDLLDRGFLIFDDEGELLDQKFEIRDDSDERMGGGIFLPYSCNGSKSYVMYFIRDLELDNGYYTKITDYNKQFEKWKAVEPGSFQKIV